MKVAFIGLGTMGVGMSLNILKAGKERPDIFPAMAPGRQEHDDDVQGKYVE